MPARGALVGLLLACVLAGVARGDEGGCAVTYDDPSPTCGDGGGAGGAATKEGGGAAAAAAAATDSGCVIEPDVDYPGDEVDGDVDMGTNVASPSACCELCKATKFCRFWTFSTPERGRQPNFCWLKNKRVKPYRTTNNAAGLVSGYVAKNKTQRAAKGTADAPSEQKGATEAAKQAAKKAAKKQQKAKGLVSEASALYQKGQGREAEALLKKAVAADETSGSARMWLGLVLEQLGEWQNAIFAYEAALAPGRIGSLRDSDAAMTHNNLGLLYRNKQNRHDDAEAQYRVCTPPGESAAHARCDTSPYTLPTSSQLPARRVRVAAVPPSTRQR